MADPEDYFSAMDGFRKMDEMVFGSGPPREPPVEPPSGNGDSPKMNPLADLTTRMGKVETAMEGLRHSQNILAGVLAAGLALILTVLIYLAQDLGDQVRDMNARFDRFLERQADAAATANARFDRLLEQRATQSPATSGAPIIIQVPTPLPSGQNGRREEEPSPPR